MTEINRFGEDQNMIPEVPINPGEDIDEAMEEASRKYDEATRRNAELTRKLGYLVAKQKNGELNEKDAEELKVVIKEHDETRKIIDESGKKFRKFSHGSDISSGEISG